MPGTGPSVQITEIRVLAADPNGNFHNVDILPYLELHEEIDPWDLEEKILESHEE